MQVVSANANVRTGDTVRRHRLGGLSLAHYAEASAAREIELDEAGVVMTWSGIQGGSPTLWARLEAQAARYGVPFVAGDLERTNRVEEWDALVASSRHAQAAWRDSYTHALLRLQGLDPETMVGRVRVESVKSSQLCMNAVAPLGRRRPAMTGLATRPTDRRTPVPSPLEQSGEIAVAPADDGTPAPLDPVVFPGERLARISDFVRIDVAAEKDGLEAVLAREGIDAAYYGLMSQRWATRLRKDPWLAEKHHAIKHPSPKARAGTPKGKPRLALVADAADGEKHDPIVFAGEKLARISDFVRLARAARSADFLGTLHAEGLHPVYYAHMCKRFEGVRKSDAALERAFRQMMGNA